MNKKRQKANETLIVALVAAAFVITSVCLITGPNIRGGYDIEAGAPSPMKFKAPRAIVNEVATEKLRAEAEKTVTPLYVKDPGVNDNIAGKLNAFFDEIDRKRAVYMPIIFPDEPETPEGYISLDKSQLGIEISDLQLTHLITSPTPDYVSLLDSVYGIIEMLLADGIKEGTIPKSLQFASDALNRSDLGRDEQALAYGIISAVTEPNFIVDVETTEKERRERAAQIEPVYLQSGQTIVDEGEIVGSEAYAILDELGYVNRSFAKSLPLLSGALIYASLIFAVAVIYIYFYREKMIYGDKDVLLLFTLYAITVILTRAMTGLPFYFLPVVLFSVLTSMLISFRLSVVLNFCVTLIAALVYNGDMAFVIYFLINGIFACLMARYIVTRSRALSVASLMSVLSALTVLSAYLLFDRGFSKETLDSIVYSVLSALLTVIISLGTLPFWEFAFGVVTSVRLLDLINPNKPLLRRLIIEAPGTYHHSLIVSTLAETAAFDIGANHVLARVGGYYHDIGKIKYPQYFSENQVSGNPHDGIDPLQSAKVITEHVDYGMELADEYNLPSIIKDFIEQHHGSSMIKYFFYKAQKENPNVSAEEYRYKRAVPCTRETAIVMLADTIEAAVRSMIPSGKNMSEVEALVRTLVKDKLDDGQLTESGLEIKHLDTVVLSFMRVFKGMYHERIAYPKGTTKELTERLGESGEDETEGLE